MGATITATGWQIGMMLPARGRWQQFRLKATDTYTCARCDVVKTTQLVAVADRDWSAPTCSDCYQLVIAEEDSEPATVDAPTPPGHMDLQQPRPAFDQFTLFFAACSTGSLTDDQRRAMTELEASDAYPAALTYAEALLERPSLGGVDPTEADRGAIRKSLQRERSKVASQRSKREAKHQTRSEGEAGSGQDPLPALLLSRYRPSVFAAKLTEVMTEQGLTRGPRDLPIVTLWGWITVLDESSEDQMPADAKELYELSGPSFLNHLIAVAQQADPHLGALSHPAVLERWVQHSKRATKSLRNDRKRLAKQAAKSDPDHQVQTLAEADTAYAMGRAMEVIASQLRDDLQRLVDQRLQRWDKRAERTARLIEAANRVVRAEPRLARPVGDICLQHNATCMAAARGNSCADCVPTLISRLTAVLATPALRTPPPPPIRPEPVTRATPSAPAKPSAKPPAPRLVSPSRDSNTRWLPTGDRIRPGTVRAAWQVAVTRDDMNRRRCPIPDGTVLPSHETRKLRLYFEHPGVETRPQNVVLRMVAGRWQIDGVRWPSSLPPGLLLDFTWRTDSTSVTAVTKPLRRPERVDGIEFRHEFDRQVVTRELDRDGDPRQPLTVERWVLRTLRILGHLCPQGTATLAEDALVRNCLDLGMPERMTGQIHEATTVLIKAGRIRRVRGGRSTYGDLSYPARPGDTSVTLIRYQPTVEILKPQSFAKMGTPTQRGAHQVHGFIRRLPAGAHASDKQLELYEEAVQAAEVANHGLDPDRYTFVAKFRRGATRGGR